MLRLGSRTLYATPARIAPVLSGDVNVGFDLMAYIGLSLDLAPALRGSNGIQLAEIVLLRGGA